MKRLLSKIWNLKFSFVFFPKIAIFAKFSKNHVIFHFYRCLASAISKVHSDLFIFNNVIHILLKVPSIRIFLSMGSLNGHNLPG